MKRMLQLVDVLLVSTRNGAGAMYVPANTAAPKLGSGNGGNTLLG